MCFVFWKQDPGPQRCLGTSFLCRLLTFVSTHGCLCHWEKLGASYLSYIWLQAVFLADMQGPGLAGREQTQNTVCPAWEH